jgi:hypothetical protein
LALVQCNGNGYVSEIGGQTECMRLYLSLSRLNHRLPWGQVYPEVGYFCPTPASVKSAARGVVYLQRAGKYKKSAGRLSQEQKGLDERLLRAAQWPSHPWGRPRSRSCGRTSSAQAASPCHFPLPCVLIPALAAAMAARGRAALLASSRHGPSAPRPWPASVAATSWRSLYHSSAQAQPEAYASSHAAGKNCHIPSHCVVTP